MTPYQKDPKSHAKSQDMAAVWEFFTIYGADGYGSGLSVTPNQNSRLRQSPRILSRQKAEQG